MKIFEENAIAMSNELRRIRKKQESLFLLMTDIDDLKLINDKYGHITGYSYAKDIVIC